LPTEQKINKIEIPGVNPCQLIGAEAL